MPRFGLHSLKLLSECDPRIQQICNEAIKYYDFAVVCGHRNQEEQDECFRNGTSKLRYPKSKHNSLPSLAVDLVPYPIDWKDIKRFKQLGVIMKREADKLGIRIRWGGDFIFFKDYPHFEVI